MTQTQAIVINLFMAVVKETVTGLKLRLNVVRNVMPGHQLMFVRYHPRPEHVANTWRSISLTSQKVVADFSITVDVEAMATTSEVSKSAIKPVLTMFLNLLHNQLQSTDVLLQKTLVPAWHTLSDGTTMNSTNVVSNSSMAVVKETEIAS